MRAGRGERMRNCDAVGIQNARIHQVKEGKFNRPVLETRP